MIEILELRQENTKTYDLGSGKRRLESHIGARHYRDDYSNPHEVWKDIDLTIRDGRITAAPYELTIAAKKLTFKDKKTGEVSTIELVNVNPAGIPFEIIPEFSAVRFQHILPTDKVPFEAQFKVSGKAPITRAFDDEGELALETTFVDGVLTEKLSQVKSKDTGQVRPAKGNIRIDPTWQVGAITDNARVSPTSAGYFSTTQLIYVGYLDATLPDLGLAARFLNVTIPPGSTVTLAQLKVTNVDGQSLTVVNTRLRAQNHITPATFSTDADFDTRTWTTAFVNWDAIPAWTTNVEYTSPDILTCIQEVIDLSGWASGNPIVILWDDFQRRSTQTNDRYRKVYDYNDSAAAAPKLVIEYTAVYEALATSSLTLSDLTRGFTSITATIAETLRTSDLARTVCTFEASILDSLALSEIQSIIVTISLIADDNLVLTDVASKIVDLFGDAVDSIVFNDSPRGVIPRVISLTVKMHGRTLTVKMNNRNITITF